MPLQKLPVNGSGDPNHERRVRETINGVLTHQFDDSRVQTPAEKLAGITPVNYAYPPYNVLRYGADPTGATSSQGAFEAVRDVAAAAGTNVQIVFPSGTYSYDTSPNWAIDNLILQAEGEVVLSFTGAGNAWVFDSGDYPGYTYNVRCLGNFVINGSASAVHGFYIRSVHHSEFEGKVKNVTGSGCDINFSVGSIFRVKTTVDRGSFSTTPTRGYYVKGRDEPDLHGEYSAWCNFHDTVIDSCSGFGIDILNGSGCSFFGGFIEYCLGGIRVDSSYLCQHNTFYSVDCERNTGYDAEIHGQHNHLYGCTNFSNATHDNLIVGADAVGTQIIGGYHKVCTLTAGSEETLFLNCSFANTSPGITGSSQYRAIGCYFVDPGTAARTSSMVDVYGSSTTFTPTIIGSTTAGTQTYSAQVGLYRKIGDLVHFQLFVAISAKGGTMAGDVVIDGLPFTLNSTTNLFASFAISDYSGLTNAAGRTQFLARGSPGTTLIRLIEAGSAVASQPVPVASLAASSFIAISGTYQT